jgi:hypothetical protein
MRRRVQLEGAEAAAVSGYQQPGVDLSRKREGGFRLLCVVLYFKCTAHESSRKWVVWALLQFMLARAAR